MDTLEAGRYRVRRGACPPGDRPIEAVLAIAALIAEFDERMMLDHDRRQAFRQCLSLAPYVAPP